MTPSVAAATTMMKPKVVDSAAPQVITTYFSPKMPPEMSNNHGTKKAQAGMAGKQSKMTQLPTNTMALWHKSPMSLKQNQMMA